MLKLSDVPGGSWRQYDRLYREHVRAVHSEFHAQDSQNSYEELALHKFQDGFNFV